METIPTEMLKKIIKNLNFRSVYHLRLVNKKWKKIHDELWMWFWPNEQQREIICLEKKHADFIEYCDSQSEYFQAICGIAFSPD